MGAPCDKPPLVSVIIPVFKRNQVIERAVQSVLNQTYTNLELIIVDDNSPSPVWDALAHITDPRLIDVRRTENGGAGAARNSGASVASGEYIAFLDSDDEWFPEKLSRQIDALLAWRATNPKVAGVASGFLLHRKGGRNSFFEGLRIPKPVDGPGRLVWGCDISPGSTLVVGRREFLDSGGFNESYTRLEDWEWLIRFTQQHKIGMLGECLCRVYLVEHPSLKSIMESLTVLKRAHGPTFLKISTSYYLRFLSSIYLERAAGNWREGKAVSFLYGLLAISLCPFRSGGFYFNILRKIQAHRDIKPKQDEPVRVLHVINSLGAGGAERMLSNLLLASSDARLQQYVVAIKKNPFYEDVLEAKGITIEYLNIKDVASLIRGIAALAGFLVKHRPAIVCGWMYHSNLFSLLALWLSGRRRNTGLIWGIRCSHLRASNYSRQLRAAIWLSRLFSNFPDLIVANSHRGREDHIAYGFRRRDFAVLLNGFDTTAFAPCTASRQAVREELGLAADDFVVGVIARTDPMKGYPLLFEAMEGVEGVRCVIVGEGTDRLDRPAHTIALGIRRDVAHILNGFDVLISCSSYGEGMSNSIGEAMASGLPIIATDVGDAARLIGDTGILISPDDRAALTQAIMRMRDDPELRKRLAEKARRRVERKFSLDGSRDNFFHLFKTLEFKDSAC